MGLFDSIKNAFSKKGKDTTSNGRSSDVRAEKIAVVNATIQALPLDAGEVKSSLEEFVSKVSSTWESELASASQPQQQKDINDKYAYLLGNLNAAIKSYVNSSLAADSEYPDHVEVLATYKDGGLDILNKMLDYASAKVKAPIDPKFEATTESAAQKFVDTSILPQNGAPSSSLRSSAPGSIPQMPTRQPRDFSKDPLFSSFDRPQAQEPTTEEPSVSKVSPEEIKREQEISSTEAWLDGLSGILGAASKAADRREKQEEEQTERLRQANRQANSEDIQYRTRKWDKDDPTLGGE